MSKNLLVNPSFEGGWTDLTQSIQLPNDWAFFSYSGEKAGYQPEVRDEDGNIIIHEQQWMTHDPELVLRSRDHLPQEEHDLYIVDGDWCAKLFAGHKAFHAELLQNIALEPGATYRLTVHAFVDTFVWEDGKKPPQSNEPVDKRAARIALFAGDQEKWFDEKSFEDWYLNRHELSFEFVAYCDEEEVGIEVWHPWPVDNNGWFLDAFELVKIAEPDPEPEPPEPPEPEDWVYPNEPWVKKSVLLPQSADEEWRAVMGAAASAAKLSDLQSAEDAFSGPPNRTVYAVNPDEWGKDPTLAEWAEDTLPGAEMVPIVTTSPYEAAILILPDMSGDIAVAQTDMRWAGKEFGEGPGSTIERYGCFLCGLCIALRKTYGKDLTPDLLDRLLLNARVAWFADNLLYWEAAVDLFPAFDDRIKDNSHWTASALQELLDEGWEVVLPRADQSHFVYLEDVEGESLRIIDTWDGRRKTWAPEDARGVRAAHVKEGSPPPPPPPPGPQLEATKILAFHAQWNTGGLADATGSLGMVKIVEDFGMIPHMPEGAFILARNWLDRDQVELYTQAGPERHFDEQIRPLIDQYPQIDAIEDGMNEEVAPHNDGKNEWCAWWAVTTAELVRDYTDGRVKTVMLNPGPGAFPLEGEGIRLFKSVFRASHEHGDYIGIHPYTPAIGDLVWVNEWYPLRFMRVDRYARSLGYYPRYIGTEAGPIGGSVEWRDGVPIPHLNARAGWRSPLCLSGDWQRHQSVMWQTLVPVAEWNAEHGNRFRYLCLFTIGNWPSFNYEQAQIEDVARLAEELRG